MSVDLSSPVYLLIQPSTSLCQTREFSGFNTHYRQESQQSTDIDRDLVAAYMVLVRKRQEPTRHAPGLQNVEGGQSFGNRQPVVQLTVNNELRRSPLGQELCRVPLLVALAVLPERAAKVVDGEEELLRRPLVQGTENAVVADEGLEPAA